MYALTNNPTIHDSLVKQFWQTATAKTLADGTLELKATIDTIEYTITEDLLEQEATTSQLMTRIGDLEKQLKETKQTFGKAILTLVDRVKTLEVALKRKTKRVLLSDSEEEETEAQGRKTHDLDPLVSLVQELVTPSKTVNASGEEQVEDISPTTLEAAAILTKVQKIKSVDKGKRYKRRKSSKEFAGTGLDFEEVKSAFEKVNTGGIRVSVPSPDREEAGLAEAIRLDALEKALKGRKNQGTWKLTQLKKLNFEEVKAEFEKLVKQLDTYVPMNFEATKESLKRFGEELQTKTAKKLKFDDEGTQPTEEKIEEDKDDKPTKKTRKRRKQIVRKGFHTNHDKDGSEDSDEANEKDDSTSGTKIPINPVSIATKSPSIANYKIIKQGRKGVIRKIVYVYITQMQISTKCPSPRQK
ncbi:hypothetical protein Tco_1389788, partial [Tanacetum coccineum]